LVGVVLAPGEATGLQDGQSPGRADADVPVGAARLRVFSPRERKSGLPSLPLSRALPRGHGFSAPRAELIDGVIYVPDWIDEATEKEFMSEIDRPGAYERMKFRSSFEVGAGPVCKCGRCMLNESLPGWAQAMADGLERDEFFHSLAPVNTCRVNRYSGGDGIHAHRDGPVYLPRVAIVSLGAPRIMRFESQACPPASAVKWDPVRDVPAGFDTSRPSEIALDLQLMPRSLLFFTGPAFRELFHSLPPELMTVPKGSFGPLPTGTQLSGTRVSATLRHLLPRCSCNDFA
jgi:alkylated DNA repair protein alkB family protein 6